MSAVRARRRASARGSAAMLGDGEEVLLRTRQHPFALASSLLRGLLVLVPLWLVAWGSSGTESLRGTPADVLVGGSLIAMLGVVAWLAWQALGWEFEQVVITDEQVLHVSGVLSRRMASTPVAKVSEFSVHQPLLGRMFGYGSLVVDVPGGRVQALHGMSHLPDPAGIYRAITAQTGGGGARSGGSGGGVGSPEPGAVAVAGDAEHAPAAVGVAASTLGGPGPGPGGPHPAAGAQAGAAQPARGHDEYVEMADQDTFVIPRDAWPNDTWRSTPGT